jgi:quercetin dioxygenase-like cupin family protein
MENRGERPSSIVTEIARWPVGGLEGKEGRFVTVEFPPRAYTPPHRHPGWMFVWVLEGKVVSQMEGDAPREYGPGDSWYEGRDHLHLHAGNDSPDRPAKILVFYLTEPGQPVLVFGKSGERA